MSNKPRSTFDDLTANYIDAYIQIMRTTVTLDADVEQRLREAMRRQGKNFKETLNATPELKERQERETQKLKKYGPKHWVFWVSIQIKLLTSMALRN